MNPWLLVAIIAFAISAIALVIGIIIFFRFNIPDVIGDLSGKTLEREISAIREESNKSSKKRHKNGTLNSSGVTNNNRITDELYSASAISQGHRSKKLNNETSQGNESATVSLENIETVPLESNVTDAFEDEATMLLESEATMLPDNEKDLVQQEGTMLLGEGTTLLSEGTTVLDNAQMQQAQAKVNFNVTQTVMLVHTEENIND